MEQVRTYLYRATILALVVFTLVFGVSNLFSRHDAGGVVGDASGVLCTSLCLSHSQPVAATNAVNNLKKDDNKPSPPQYLWLQAPTNLLLLYTTIVVLAFWLLEKQKRILLTTQLRI